MSSISILIVEDEPIIADDVAMILERFDYKVEEIVDNALDAIDFLQENSVDLVLLDINIEGERDGIWLARQIKKQFQVPFIYLTSYYDPDTLNRAHATGPQGYIVKPFDEGDLIANIRLAFLKSKIKTPTNDTEKFFVRDRGELTAIEPDDILYAESDNNYTNIYTDSRKYVVTHTLKSVEEKLLNKGFIRTHKSYLVNFHKISSISEGYLFLGNSKLPVGRSYREDLLKNLSIL
ncbi:MAG: LytTR family transcriptional regulator DNA-binding domain-containing protein [Bacteroidota bacterium]